MKKAKKLLKSPNSIAREKYYEKKYLDTDTWTGLKHSSHFHCASSSCSQFYIFVFLFFQHFDPLLALMNEFDFFWFDLAWPLDQSERFICVNCQLATKKISNKGGKCFFFFGDLWAVSMLMACRAYFSWHFAQDLFEVWHFPKILNRDERWNIFFFVYIIIDKAFFEVE